VPGLKSSPKPAARPARAPLRVLSGRLLLETVTVPMSIGVLPEEHGVAQPVTIDLQLTLTHEAASQAPRDLRDCVDYGAIHHFLTVTLPARGHVDLVEQLAHIILAEVLTDRRIAEAEVTLRKPEILGGGAVAGYRLRAAAG